MDQSAPLCDSSSLPAVPRDETMDEDDVPFLALRPASTWEKNCLYIFSPYFSTAFSFFHQLFPFFSSQVFPLTAKIHFSLHFLVFLVCEKVISVFYFCQMCFFTQLWYDSTIIYTNKTLVKNTLRWKRRFRLILDAFFLWASVLVVLIILKGSLGSYLPEPRRLQQLFSSDLHGLKISRWVHVLSLSHHFVHVLTGDGLVHRVLFFLLVDLGCPFSSMNSGCGLGAHLDTKYSP